MTTHKERATVRHLVHRKWQVSDPKCAECASESGQPRKMHYHGDTMRDAVIECYDEHGDASEHAPESGPPEPSPGGQR